MLFNVYHSSFSAIATCTFNWPMVKLFGNKDKSLDGTAPTFKLQQWKRKGNMESTVWKYTMESIVNGIWNKYGNYNMSLLIPE